MITMLKELGVAALLTTLLAILGFLFLAAVAHSPFAVASAGAFIITTLFLRSALFVPGGPGRRHSASPRPVGLDGFDFSAPATPAFYDPKLDEEA